MALPAKTLGTLDCTSTDSTVTLGDAGRSETVGTICFQITGTNGGAISVIARGTMMDPDSTPTWATLGFVNRTAPGTIIAALTANGAYKIEAEGYSRVELKVDVAGTGTMVVRGRPVAG